MSKLNRFVVNGVFVDKKCTDNNDDENPITFARMHYDFNIEAEDMKKAYDIAMDYMADGSEVTAIHIDDTWGPF